MKNSVKHVLRLIEKINSDTSVPDTETLDDLEAIQGELEGYIDALKEQIKNREEREL